MKKAKGNNAQPTETTKNAWRFSPDVAKEMEDLPKVAEFLDWITSSLADDTPASLVPSVLDDEWWLIGNHFAWRGSQVNTDLALAAQCELEGDVYTEDDTYFDFYSSSEYLNLRRTFLDDARKAHTNALVKVVWRAYNAGRLSPDRLSPDSSETRFLRREARRAAYKPVIAKVSE